jgi:hypothetical protein
VNTTGVDLTGCNLRFNISNVLCEYVLTEIFEAEQLFSLSIKTNTYV